MLLQEIKRKECVDLPCSIRQPAVSEYERTIKAYQHHINVEHRITTSLTTDPPAIHDLDPGVTLEFHEYS